MAEGWSKGTHTRQQYADAMQAGTARRGSPVAEGSGDTFKHTTTASRTQTVQESRRRQNEPGKQYRTEQPQLTSLTLSNAWSLRRSRSNAAWLMVTVPSAFSRPSTVRLPPRPFTVCLPLSAPRTEAPSLGSRTKFKLS